jgi:hypothetical protein
MAAAQAERATALHKAEEALKKAADAQRKRARIRNIAFVIVSIFAVLAGLFGWRSKQQREQADDILESATTMIARLAPQTDIASRKEIFAVFRAGADHGSENSMYNLGLAYEKGQDYAKAREWHEKARASGTRRPPRGTTRAPCSTSASFTTTVRAWRRTTPRRAGQNCGVQEMIETENHGMLLIRNCRGFLGALFSALLALAVFSPGAATAQEVKQIKLTDKHIQGFMAAYEDIAKVYDGAEFGQTGRSEGGGAGCGCCQEARLCEPRPI